MDSYLVGFDNEGRLVGRVEEIVQETKEKGTIDILGKKKGRKSALVCLRRC